ncbi:MAG: hypothetical protein M1822_000582 [Bathelium mastoideum]|nr:MAG: hypothetical protein M1822_000582 [Bathelium mastoideum]
MSSQEDSLFQAVLNGNVEQTRNLLDKGADPYDEDTSGSTPLHYAAEGENLEVVELLLKHRSRVDPNTRDEAGSAALYHATNSRNLGLVELLLKHGVNPNIKNNSGSTPLHNAAKDWNTRVTDLLLKYGANPNIKDGIGSVPLHCAADSGNLGVVELLLKHGVNPNIKDDFGSAPLHFATQDGQDEMVQLLLKYWADPNIKDANESTPLHIAAGGERLIIIKLLLESRADRWSQDKVGNIPAANIPATETDRTELISLLSNPQAPTISWPIRREPTFPITINGNGLDQPKRKDTELFDPKYILVQSQARLDLEDIQMLKDAGATYLNYVSRNTYLCRYEQKNLDTIRELSPVVYVDVYGEEFKITPSLKEAKEAKPNEEYEVDITFHEKVDPGSREYVELERDLKHKSQCDERSFEFLPDMARLTMRGYYFDNVASIVDVCCIEEVGKVEEDNDVARQVLQFHSQTLTGQNGLKYKGSGQIIAVADSGLHRGVSGPIHQAFQGRVINWIAVNNHTADHVGHGTHVCGSAVGDGTTTDGISIMGTAPEAALIVQSIWDPAKGLKPPLRFGDLFKPPYLLHARVHSNSFGRYKPLDAQDRFQQMDYTKRAEQLDKFVFGHPDMVICCSAGNKGMATVRTMGEGQIGDHAAAKNCITVGSSHSSGPGQNQRIPTHPRIDNVVNSSSRGPVKGGRIKPDVVAPGTFILSAASGNWQNPTQLHPNDPRWCYKSGTSMATPLIAGCAAVLREALARPPCTSPTSEPTAALIKALLVNGAKILDPTTSPFRPDEHSGFGRVNIANAITIVQGADGAGFRERIKVPQSSPWEEDVDVKFGNNNLKATLVWSDPPSHMICNELVLEVDGNRAFEFDNNNVQQVVWKKPPNYSGKVKLRVGGDVFAPYPQQTFAVVWRSYLDAEHSFQEQFR